jgi:hypothetical protein
MKRIIAIALIVTLYAQMASAAIVNFTGAETGGTGELSTTTVTGTGATTASTTVVDTGVYSYKLDCPATTDTCSAGIKVFGTGGLQDDGSIATSYASARVYLATAPASGDEPIFTVRSPAASIKFELRVDETGHIQGYAQGTTTSGFESTAALTVGGWSCLQVKTGTGSSGSWEAYINGELATSGSGNIGTGNGAHWEWGKRTNRNSNIMLMYVDNIQLDNTSMPPCDASVLTMDPDGDGAYTTFTIETGSGSDYQVVDEVPFDSADRLQSTLVDGEASTVSLESAASAGITGTIHAVKAIAHVARAAASNSTMNLRLRSNTTNSDGADESITAATYSARQLVHVVDPATAATWDLSALGSIEVGVVEAETTDRTRVSALRVMVLFTASQGGGGGGGGCRRLLLRAGC